MAVPENSAGIRGRESPIDLPARPVGGLVPKAIEIAEKVAAERGWPWEGPILAIVRRRGWFWGGPRYWEVFSNTSCIGRNVSVAIDYATGRVLGSGFMPR